MCIRDRIAARTTPARSHRSLRISGIETAHIALSLIHISEPTRLLSTSYAVFCLQTKTARETQWTMVQCRKPISDDSSLSATNRAAAALAVPSSLSILRQRHEKTGATTAIVLPPQASAVGLDD